MKMLHKLFAKLHPARIVFAVLTLIAAALYPPLVVAAVLLTTSTARLANGTIFKVAAGSPTSFITVNNVNNITWMDGSSAEVDVSHLTSDWKERLLGLPDGGVVTFELQTDLGDSGQSALLTAKNERTKCQFQVVLPAGTTPTHTFEGYVRKFNMNASLDAPVKSSVEILVTGPVTQS